MTLKRPWNNFNTHCNATMSTTTATSGTSETTTTTCTTNTSASAAASTCSYAASVSAGGRYGSKENEKGCAVDGCCHQGSWDGSYKGHGADSDGDASAEEADAADAADAAEAAEAAEGYADAFADADAADADADAAEAETDAFAEADTYADWGASEVTTGTRLHVLLGNQHNDLLRLKRCLKDERQRRTHLVAAVGSRAKRTIVP